MIDNDEKARRVLERFMDHEYGNATWLLAGFLHSVPTVPREQAASLDMRAMLQCLRTLIDNGYKP